MNRVNSRNGAIRHDDSTIVMVIIIIIIICYMHVFCAAIRVLDGGSRYVGC